jgi:hypothetical protein
MKLGVGISNALSRFKPIKHLLRDEFFKDIPAPLQNVRLAEPGPGKLLVTDTGNRLSIEDGKAHFNGYVSQGDPSLYFPEKLARVVGRTVYYCISDLVAFLSKVFYAGFDVDLAGFPSKGSFLLNASAWRIYQAPTFIFAPDTPVAGGVEYELCIAMRGSGLHYLIRGGNFSEWTLVWVATENSDGNYYAGIQHGSADIKFDKFKIFDLPAPWNVDCGLPTYIVTGNVPQNTNFQHPVNTKIEFDVDTLPTSGSYIQVSFRFISGSSRWFVQVNSSGTLYLQELLDSVNTSRGTVVGAVSVGSHIITDINGVNISVYVDGVLKISYVNATSLNSITAGFASIGTGSAISDLIVYPNGVDIPVGLGTNWLPGTRQDGDIFTHEANCILEYVVSKLPSAGGGTNIFFRQLDSNNYWRVKVNLDGVLSLYETTTAGGTVSRASTAVGTVKVNSRIVVIADGPTIKIYVDNVLVLTYLLAENFKTATNGKLLLNDGGLSNIISWPRTLSGAALAALGNPTSVLLDDQFLTDVVAPVGRLKSSPGPGLMKVVDTENKISVSGGKLVFSGGKAVPAYTDPGIEYESVPRQSGLFLTARVNFPALSSEALLGFKRSASFDNWLDGGFKFAGNSVRFMEDGAVGQNSISIATVLANVDYQVGVALSNRGTFYLIKGGEISDWTLLWSSVGGFLPSPLYPQIFTYARSFSCDYIRTTILPAPWNSDYGLATQQLAGARNQGDTFTHEADALIEFTVDALPTSGYSIIRFRLQDASNTWSVFIDANGGVGMEEVVNGVATGRGSAAGAVANGQRVILVTEGETIKVYANGSLAITYYSATNFKSSSSGFVYRVGAGGGISNIIAWPRKLSGVALSALRGV